MTDAWLDKASGKWLTGPEVEEHGGLRGRIARLGEETMTDGNVRPVIYVSVDGRERIFAVNAGAGAKIGAYLKGRPSGTLVGKVIAFTTEIARNPRTGVTGPAVRIGEIKG